MAKLFLDFCGAGSSAGGAGSSAAGASATFSSSSSMFSGSSGVGSGATTVRLIFFGFSGRSSGLTPEPISCCEHLWKEHEYEFLCIRLKKNREGPTVFMVPMQREQMTKMDIQSDRPVLNNQTKRPDVPFCEPSSLSE